jgi:dTDP-4-dehydrorhamnose reductase
VIKQTLFGLKSGEMNFATDYEISLVSANRVLENIETLITHLLFNLPPIIHFVSEGFISRYNLAVDVAKILYPSKQIKVKATTFQELGLPESRARDSRVATVISWEPPFSKPDRLEDIVKEKSRLLINQGFLNA